MNKKELVLEISKQTGFAQKDVVKMLDSFLNVVEKTVADGGSVQLIGFGTFEKRKRNARTGHNPATGAPISIPETYVPAFKAGNRFKTLVAKQ